MNYVDEVHESAKRVACLNTIINENGKLTGYNFDGEGALVPLRNRVGNLATKKIAFLGAGGSAQGIALALAHLDHVKEIGFFMRDPKKGSELLANLERLKVVTSLFSFSIKDLKELAQFDIIINTTPIGMSPHLQETPVSSDYLETRQLVYDIIYNPKETLLLKQAAQKGLTTIGGAEMFLGQASLQYQLWFQESAPLEVMREAFEASF